MKAALLRLQEDGHPYFATTQEPTLNDTARWETRDGRLVLATAEPGQYIPAEHLATTEMLREWLPRYIIRGWCGSDGVATAARLAADRFALNWDEIDHSLWWMGGY